MWCAKCNSEYREGFDSCPYCALKKAALEEKSEIEQEHEKNSTVLSELVVSTADGQEMEQLEKFYHAMGYKTDMRIYTSSTRFDSPKKSYYNLYAAPAYVKEMRTLLDHFEAVPQEEVFEETTKESYTNEQTESMKEEDIAYIKQADEFLGQDENAMRKTGKIWIGIVFIIIAIVFIFVAISWKLSK